MKTEKILLLASVLLILTLLFISQTHSLKFIGKVSEIKHGAKTTGIKLENCGENFTIIDDAPSLIKKGDLVLIEGTAEEYKNRNQILIEKITALTT